MSVLLDTNIYGKIVEDKKDGLKIVEKILKDRNFVVHNFRVIRNELRKAPNILRVYDKIVSRRIIVESKQIKKLANEYFKEYKSNGGVQRKTKNFLNDLKIVACASIKSFDVIFSDDERTMKSKVAVESYKAINLKYNYRTPTFYKYKDLKKKYIY